MKKTVISVADTTIIEGNSRTTQVALTLKLSSKALKPITVKYNTVDGTATLNDNDYIKTLGTVTFKKGETTKTIFLKINGDNHIESDEYFNIQFTNQSTTLASIDVPFARITIQNDDIKPTITRYSQLTDYEKENAIVINGHESTDYKTSGYRGEYKLGYFNGERQVYLFKNIHQVSNDVPIVFAVKGLNGFQPDLSLYKYNSTIDTISFYNVGSTGANGMNELGLFNRSDWTSTDAEFDDTESWYKQDLGIPSYESFNVYAVVQNYWKTSDDIHGGFIVGVF